MTRYQRAKRLAWWRGFAIALLAFTAWIATLGYVEHLTS